MRKSLNWIVAGIIGLSAIVGGTALVGCSQKVGTTRPEVKDLKEGVNLVDTSDPSAGMAVAYRVADKAVYTAKDGKVFTIEGRKTPSYGADKNFIESLIESIWMGSTPVFAGNKYADLSETCLHYIGGIIKHAKAINAFTNPSTNSYKRLVPGYEAPVLLAYSARNRSASCRIPYTSNPKAKRVEVRFPDPMANPYLAFAAMLMAGLDGIKNKIDPGPAMDKDLYDLPKEELKQIPTVCGSLREALENLDKDRGFLKNGGVFDDDFIDSFIELKMTEVARFEMTPHPVEFEMYYSL